MKLYAPKYYKDFKCTADKCSHSCCIGWEIDVDPDTREKYACLKDGYGRTIQESIDEEGDPHFRLDAQERCPHLNEKGLCRIILEVGEEYLCDICREHPRFYNETLYGQEVGVGMACEEACRLILEADDYMEMVEIGEAGGAAESSGVEDVDQTSYDAVAHRDAIYSILANAEVPYAERLRQISEMYEVYLEILEDEDWRDLLDSLEYLNDAHRKYFSCYTSDVSTPKDIEKSLERVLAYFIYRNCSPCCHEDAFYESLGFAMLCERLVASMAKLNGTEKIAEYAQMVSEELEYCEENTDAIKAEFFEGFETEELK